MGSIKTCTLCRESLPFDAFYKDRQRQDGLYPQCRACQKRKYEANPGPQREAAKRYYYEHKEARIAKSSAWQKTPEGREWHRQYRERNREMLRAKDRARSSTRAPIKRAWREANRERVRAQYAAWQQAHREEVVAYSAERRLRRKRNGGSYTAEEWRALKEAFGFTCLRCGKTEPDIKLHADHVVAIANGGDGTIDNIQPLCGPCNSSKHTRTIDYRR
jgi:5-methylcytosine-specific restriction endonuclease McrA